MSILDTLDDCVVVAGHDHHRIHANTYIMVQNCDIFRMAYEDMIEDATREFHAPNVSGRIMQILVNLLHKKINPSDITSVDDILDVFEAQRYLACGYKRSRLSNQLWELVRALDVSTASMRVMVKTAPQLLESHPREFLSKARVVSKLKFETFRKIFEHVDMTPKLAKSCMTESLSHFSPLMMLHILVSTTPPGLKFFTVLECLSLYKVGCYFHPEEYFLALQMLMQYRVHAKLDIPPYVVEMSKTSLDACHNVNSPSCLSKATASLVTIQGKPRASFFIHILKNHCKIRLTFQHNVAHIHKDGDTLECRFLLGKLGEYAHVTDDAHVRIVYVTAEEDNAPEYETVHEEWIHVVHVDHDEHDAIDIRDQFVTSSILRYIRIDIFWLHNPVDM